jgi:hypothetical protein
MRRRVTLEGFRIERSAGYLDNERDREGFGHNGLVDVLFVPFVQYSILPWKFAITQDAHKIWTK